MFEVLVTILVLTLIIGVAFWILTQIPLPDPFAMVARVVLGLIFLLLLLGLLFGGVDMPRLWPRR